MQPDDVFHRHIAEATADLAQWGKEMAPFAEIVVTGKPAYWAMTVKPRITGACPFELLLRSDQFYDIVIAREVYEDRPIEDAGIFPILVRSIACGDVERRLVSSCLTGMLQSIETLVVLGDGLQWSANRDIIKPAARAPEDLTEIKTLRFVPYCR
jgi:hypothetical protein